MITKNEYLPADEDGLTGSFSSVIYPGGGVSVIGNVALSGSAKASSRLGRSGRSVGICDFQIIVLSIINDLLA